MRWYDRLLLAMVVLVVATLTFAVATDAHAWFGIPGTPNVDLFWFLRR